SGSRVWIELLKLRQVAQVAAAALLSHWLAALLCKAQEAACPIPGRATRHRPQTSQYDADGAAAPCSPVPPHSSCRPQTVPSSPHSASRTLPAIVAAVRSPTGRFPGCLTPGAPE